MNTSNLQWNQVTQDLRSSVADLNGINPWQGLLRFCSLGLVCLSLIVLAWQSESWWGFVGYSAIAGFVYALWFIRSAVKPHPQRTEKQRSAFRSEQVGDIRRGSDELMHTFALPI
ncbi:fatty acid desaturase [Leptolyngbya sp. NIES-3755]|nr:fatty acid desaturase [Leptolyngbya sp. NIES-3755]